MKDGTTIYKRLVAAGVAVDHHESDLYVEATAAARWIIESDKTIQPAQEFTDGSGRRWVEIPFAYDPFWASPRAASNLRRSTLTTGGNSMTRGSVIRIPDGPLIASATDMAEALRMALDCLSDPHPSTAQRVDSINAINAALLRAGIEES